MKERFETFTALITKTSRNIKKLKNREMEQYGLRSSHISCLYFLYSAESLTATEICERCEEDKATVSRALDYLEENGYVNCESKSVKRYKSPFFLTEKGKEIGKEIYDKVNFVLSEIDKELSEEDRIVFYRGLTVISDCIERVTLREEGK